MNERDRLQELRKYKVLDTPPEEELDDIAEIASAICDTPISLISFVDEKRQWFKAKKGLVVQETPRSDSFCQHALQSPQEVLVVQDPLADERFKDNPLVLGDPHIRFYAGAPLQTPRGQVLGTLCVIDNKAHEITENQKKALMLLAKRTVSYLETRRLLLEQGNKIELSATRLKRLSDLMPGVMYQYEIAPDGRESFPFVSKGITSLHPSLSPEKLKANPETAFCVIHPEDIASVRASIQTSFRYLTNWSQEYRVRQDDGTLTWYWGNAKPERRNDGTVVWYGTLQNITERKEYIKTLEQILFDISHTLRRPVATMLGLTSVIETQSLNEETFRTFAGHLKTVSEEMDWHIKKLNQMYLKIQSTIMSRTQLGE